MRALIACVAFLALPATSQAGSFEIECAQDGVRESMHSYSDCSFDPDRSTYLLPTSSTGPIYARYRVKSHRLPQKRMTSRPPRRSGAYARYDFRSPGGRPRLSLYAPLSGPLPRGRARFTSGWSKAEFSALLLVCLARSCGSLSS